jgi:hypothetical protein
MSVPEEQQPAWLDPGFWEKLDRLEGHHQRVQCEHNEARRGLERLSPREPEELRQAWRRYCDVIAELERTAAEFEALRACSE